MKSEKKVIPFLQLNRWKTFAVTALVILAGSIYAQDVRQQQQESEKLFAAAAAAEQRNDLVEAERRYEECRNIAQKHRLSKMEAVATHRLAVIQARKNQFTESASLFKRAIELDPKNVLILCDFAQLHVNRKDINEAELILKNALSMEPNNPKVLYNLGLVIADPQRERQTEGLRYLRLAVGEADAYRELARIYRSKGDTGRAEFAEQKATLANRERSKDQTASRDVLAAAPTGNYSRPVQTPPEFVNRVREELVLREIVEEVHRTAASSASSTSPQPVAQTPVVPTTPTTLATPQDIVAENTAIVGSFFPLPPLPNTSTQTAATESPTSPTPPEVTPQTQLASEPPVDPFATIANASIANESIVKKEEMPSATIRRLDPPPVDVSPASSTVRALPRRSEPSPTVQPTNAQATTPQPTNVQTTNAPPTIVPPINPSIAPEIPSPVQVAEIKPANNNNEVQKPEIVKIVPSVPEGRRLPLRALPKRPLNSPET